MFLKNIVPSLKQCPRAASFCPNPHSVTSINIIEKHKWEDNIKVDNIKIVCEDVD